MIRWDEFLRAYGIVIPVWILSFVLIGTHKGHWSMPSAVAQTLFLLAYSYFGHVAIHYATSRDSWTGWLNPHIFIHHDKWMDVPRWLDLTIETVVNLGSFLLLFPLQRLLGIHWLSTSMVWAAGLLYVAVHILDYSLLGDANHKVHHQKEKCNYAPDFMDVLFGTQCDSEAPYQDASRESLHACAVTALVLGLQHIYGWD
jgi:hypothetical protein